MSKNRTECRTTLAVVGALFLTLCLLPAGAARGEPTSPFFVEITTSCCAAAGAELEVTCEQGDTTWICLGRPLEDGDRLVTTVVKARQGKRNSETTGTENCDYRRPECGAAPGSCVPTDQLQIETATCEVKQATGPACLLTANAGGASEIRCAE